jgi:hypothetical protein
LAIELAATALGPLSERVGEDVLLIDFGNAVGILDISGVGSVEVVSGKWSRADHDAMLHELSMVASALPFAAGATGVSLVIQIFGITPLCTSGMSFLRRRPTVINSCPRFESSLLTPTVE